MAYETPAHYTPPVRGTHIFVSVFAFYFVVLDFLILFTNNKYTDSETYIFAIVDTHKLHSINVKSYIHAEQFLTHLCPNPYNNSVQTLPTENSGKTKVAKQNLQLKLGIAFSGFPYGWTTCICC